MILTHLKLKSLFQVVAVASFGLIFFIFFAGRADASTMYLDPPNGQFQVGDTFQVSILLDTEGQEVNTIESSLVFPPDKLQIVSPTAGNSIINIYTTPPRFNNLTGKIDVAGGIPGGIKTNKGLITTVTFKVRSSGTASIRFLDNSKALLNDGQGTNSLNTSRGSSYQLVLPPPAGPIVSSETHPESDKWYKNSSAILTWQTSEEVEGYSYELNQEPISLPDNVIESREKSIIYKQLNDGIYFFHIKSFRKGEWGGVTHFGFKIDTTPPAQFPIEIYPSKRTDSSKPVIEFLTTDQSSGIDRYEIKIVSLDNTSDDELFFIQANSPFTPEKLGDGAYEVLVRAYDKADNYVEIAERLEIVPGVGRFFSLDGLFLPRLGYVGWQILIPLLLLLLILLILAALLAYNKHKKVHVINPLPTGIVTQLEELQKYRSKYGKLVAILVLCFGFSLTILSPFRVTAQEQIESLGSPIISNYSKTITDKEILYVSGRTSEPNTEISLRLQKISDGQTFQYKLVSDKRGDWFYRHNGFLTAGEYVIWAQSIRGQELSAPSAQASISVHPLAFSIAGNRISYPMLYVGIISILSFFIITLISYLVLILKATKKKRLLLQQEMARAEEVIHQGFISLRNDLALELALVRKANLAGELAGEEKIREEQIQNDLANIEKYVAREIEETKAIEGLA